MNCCMIDLCLLFLLHASLPGQYNAFTLHCPFHSQWTIRAKELCNIPDRYHCLYNANEKQNIEACREGPQFDAPGYKIQIIGSLESVLCARDRYQPFTFWTNSSNLCKFEKSLCTGEGQVLFSFGTTKADSTCRCDYTKGYAFVVRPTSPCFCMPTKEDCSCFIRQCPRGSVLSPEYKCTPEEKLPAISQCPIKTISVETPKPEILSKNVQQHYSLGKASELICIQIIGVVLVFLVIGICIIYFIEDNCESNIHGYDLQNRPGITKVGYTIEKENLEKFVPTRASLEIVLAIKETPCVLITGPFGSGKTTIAYHIISVLEREDYEIIYASDPEEIVRRFCQNQRQLFLIDEVFGKYTANISDIADKWKKHGPSINAILTCSNTVKILITCRTYIYQLNAKYFEILRHHVSVIHKSLISEELRLNLEERRNIYKSYIESDPPESLSEDILSLYNFYPLICSTYSQNNILEYFKHPYKIISAEISCMQKHFDIGYLALAILVIVNNKVEISKISDSSHSLKTSHILRDIFKESCFNQHPSINMLLVTFFSLKGEFIVDDETFFSLLSPELFEVVAVCIGGSFMQSILTHSSSVFIKEKLQLSTTQGNECPHTIKVLHSMESKFYQRLVSDMNKNLIFDVLSNKIFHTKKHRETFLGYLENHFESKKLVNATTGPNVLHIISSLGYSDFLTYFLKYRKCPSVNKKNSSGETPLHLACQNGHMQCVQCLIKYKAVVNETDLNKRTALHYACEAGVEDIVKYLITNSASINNKDLKGMIPLHIACEKGHFNVVKCLVEKKANLNQTDKKMKTPLHYACKHSMCNIVYNLISNKAHVNKSDDQGSTPLHIACEYGNKEVVDLLVKHKGNRNIKNKQGLRPADIALQNRFETIYNSLISVQDN